ERLLALVIAEANGSSGTAGLADRIQLVDEYNARRFLLRLFEQIADASRADSDEHLHELGSGDREKCDPCFSGNGFRQQRLARAWGPHQEDSLGYAPAQLLILRRLTQKVDDFLQLQLGFVQAGNVRKGDLDPAGLVMNLRPILTKRQRSASLRDAAHPGAVNHSDEYQRK